MKLISILVFCAALFCVPAGEAGGGEIAFWFPFDEDSRLPDGVVCERVKPETLVLENAAETTSRPGHAAIGSGCLEFTGLPDKLSAAVIPGASKFGKSFTLAAFVNDSDNRFARLFTTYRGGGPPQAGELVFDFDPSGETVSGLRFVLGEREIQSKLARFSDDDWHHMAVTYDNGAVALYLDGVEVARDSLPSGDVVLNRDLRIGEDAGGAVNEQLRGRVDDVLVLGRALNSEQIKALSERGPGRKKFEFAADAARKGLDKMPELGTRREVFVDGYLIERMQGASLTQHRPVPAGVAIGCDRPWEGKHNFAYCTVMKDGDIYRAYYRSIPKLGADGDAGEFYCYAESKDGIAWEKPNLGLYEIMGTKDNNVILAQCPPFTHNFAPFRDDRPDVPAAEKYKALGGISTSNLVAFVSPDGIHWKKLRDEPVFRDDGWVFDSQNVAFWSETEKCYVLYYRKCPQGVRAIARATSADFLNWSAPEMMFYSNTGSTKPDYNLYINQTEPYFRAPHIYVSTAARFMPGRRAITDAEFSGLKADPDCPWLKDDCSDAVLMTTRGGTWYDCSFPEAFIRPGPGAGNWVSRTNYPARGIVPTGDGGMSVYASGYNGQENCCLNRFVWRLDGFASVHASYAGGEMTTRPLTFGGRNLEINYATSAAGGIRIEIQEEDGTPIKGFSLTECPEIIGDRIAYTVFWKDGSDLSALAGRPVRLRFVMKDADLYSLRFRE
ncbi:MAG TPA: hypothetical protein PL033_19860 [Candidatus Brocadiia bacterium]|nr:hypothetical protein [Candidatus Brocadiia bacterium]